MEIRVAILTGADPSLQRALSVDADNARPVSDRVSAGSAEDTSSPALRALCETQGWSVVAAETVPDSVPRIQNVVRKWSDEGGDAVDLILTTGGTGFGVRDNTPEAVAPLIDRAAPGITTAMITASLVITPMAALSRPVAGVRRHTLILTLPGSRKGAIENLNAVVLVLPHAVELARGGQGAGEATHASMAAAEAGKLVGGAGMARHGGHKHSHRGGGHVCHHRDDILPVPGAEINAFGLSNDPSAPVSRRVRKSPYPLIPFDQALALVMQHAAPLPPRRHPVDESLAGYVLAADAVARDPVPAYRASVVDGYAVVTADGPGTYPVVAAQSAGEATSAEGLVLLRAGNVARVTTGAMVPAGTEAVVMVEDTELVETDDAGVEERMVKILVQARVGENIREIGSDAAVGEVMLEKNSVVSAAGGEVGLLASVGITEVLAIPHPAIAILSTGNELVPFNTPSPLPHANNVRDTNTPTLRTAIQTTLPHCKVLTFPAPAQDTEESLADLLQRAMASEAEVIITTGGVSMGEADLVKSVLERRLGAQLWFGRVAMKPGKPCTFATVQPKNGGRIKLVFGLPGNPVSALVGFYLFVVPAVRSMAGYSNPKLTSLFVKIAHSIPLDSRPEFYRARVVIESNSQTKAMQCIAHGTGSQMSSRLLSMKGANVLLKLPPSSAEWSELKEGEVVEAWVIGDL
ncbi:hypothetical protein BC830DRAFT_1064739 [Chytriomyces sp. MP71]|nr:hypothetical protein BC830DRAFT_1064739 [Chytriomyces sp. MP71]